MLLAKENILDVVKKIPRNFIYLLTSASKKSIELDKSLPTGRMNCIEVKSSLGRFPTKIIKILNIFFQRPITWVSENVSKLFRGDLESSLRELSFELDPNILINCTLVKKALKSDATMTAARF